MSNEKFKVKFGLAVGDTVATIDATTGDIVTNGDIQLGGNDIKASDGVVAQTLVPITSNNPNTDFSGNIVKGALRTGNGESTGDIYQFAGTLPSTGISLDNTDKTADRTTVAMRNFGSGLSGGTPRNVLIAESARGTAASPTNLTVSNPLFDIIGTGYTSTGWISDTLTSAPAILRLTTAEAWNNGVTNVGATIQALLQPTATTLTTSGSSLIPVFSANPQSFNSRSDAFSWSQGKTGSTVNMTLDVNGNLAITGDLRINGNDILASDGTTNITLTSNTLTTFAGDIKVTGNDIQASDGNNNITLTSNTLTTFAGDIKVGGNDIQASDGNNNITMTSNTLTTFAGDIKVAGNDIQASDGVVAMTMVPITSNNPNTDFSGNIVKGVLRTGSGEANGNIFELVGSTLPSTGISIDNTDKTADRTSIVLRNYGSGLSGGLPRNNIIMESARGTAASPTNVGVSDNILEMWGTGYTSTGWVTDQVNAPPGLIRLRASENWSNGLNNVGTRFQVLLQPAATTLTTGGASLQTTLNFTPESSSIRTDNFAMTDKLNNRSVLNMTADDGSGKPTMSVLKTNATSGSEFPIVNFTTQRSSGGTYSPTQSGDRIGEFKYNGNALSGSSPGGTPGPAASIAANATENWTTSAQGTRFDFSSIKQGTLDRYSVIQGSPDNLNLNSTLVNLNDYTGSTPLIGNNIVYNRVYGQWQYNTTVTPAASNTAYVFPIGTADFNNIATVGSTSRIIPGAAGMYKLQFSLQVENSDNGTEHTAYIWWRKNGTDVPASMGRITVPKAGSTIAGWDNMISSANTTDYWELAYATDDATHISFPFYASTAFGPSTAALFTTLVPIGA